MGQNGKKYICSFCHNEFLWEDSEIWGCDECNKYFCTSCYEKKTGEKIQYIFHTENVLCPDCLNGGLKDAL